MKKLKEAILKFPEFLLILAVLFYWMSSAVIANPIAIGLLVLLITQLVFQNKIIGIIIPGILILGCLFMLLALMSEFSEFLTFDKAAQKLLFVGLSFFLSTILISGIMIYKYAIVSDL